MLMIYLTGMDHLPKVEMEITIFKKGIVYQKDRYVLDLRYIEVPPLYLLGVSNHSTPMPSQLFEIPCTYL